MSETATVHTSTVCPALTEFRQNLLLYIKQHYGSQLKFAKALRTSPTTVSKWVHGNTPPRRGDWHKLTGAGVVTEACLEQLASSYQAWRKSRVVSADAAAYIRTFERTAAKVVALYADKPNRTDDESKALDFALAIFRSAEARIKRYEQSAAEQTA